VFLESLRFEALGTGCQLFSVGGRPEELAGAAAWVGVMHSRLTRFDAASELSQLNDAAGRWVPVSTELEALLKESLRAYLVSGGLVHAGVLRALVAAGYARPFKEGPSTVLLGVPPPPPLPDMLAVGAGRARLQEGTGVDLGGIAKGWLADRLAERLGANCLVNLGGDLFARGGGPEGSGWPVGFAGKTLLLKDLGAATSGTRYRRWGADLHHLIDPRSGLPAVSDLEEVSVLAPTGADAEIFAKTALLLGREAGDYFLSGRSPGWWLYP